MTAPEVGRVVGRLARLWRYPVKSMAPEPLERVEVDRHGVVGDRRWGFIHADREGDAFPCLTVLEQPELARCRPRLVEAGPPEAMTRVRTPDGADREVTDPELAAQLGAGVRVMKLDPGAFDSFPLALISQQTLAGLGALVGRALAIERFRPNLLIDCPDGAAFAEDDWVGSTVRIGALRVRIDKRDQRCVIVNIDPDTGERDPAVLRAIAHNRQTCLGVYASITTPGVIAVGDPVVLEAGGRR